MKWSCSDLVPFVVPVSGIAACLFHKNNIVSARRYAILLWFQSWQAVVLLELSLVDCNALVSELQRLHLIYIAVFYSRFS
jgi:hypothetical protein